MTRFRITTEPVSGPEVADLLARYAAEIATRWSGDSVTGGEASVERTLKPPNGAVLVARLTPEPDGDDLGGAVDNNDGGAGPAVACAGVRRLTEHIGEVKRMYVDPSCRGAGLGRLLLVAVEELARGWGLERLRLDTRTDLVEALALYRSAGYRDIPRYNDNPYAAHWLEKRLVPPELLRPKAPGH